MSAVVATATADRPTAVMRAEQRVLNAFWAAAQAVGSRLELLQEYTHVILRRPDDWSPETLRAEHVERSPSAITLDRKRCFSCGGEGQLYRHHIIELQYGGSNTARNQVPLCFSCHQFLHPWLTDDDRAPQDRRARGFESIGDVMSRMRTLDPGGSR